MMISNAVAFSIMSIMISMYESGRGIVLGVSTVIDLVVVVVSSAAAFFFSSSPLPSSLLFGMDPPILELLWSHASSSASMTTR